MRSHLSFYLNGQPQFLSGEWVFQPITDWLRYQQGLTGTKVVCAEGDCGACTLLIGRPYEGKLRYLPVNGCIQYGYQIDSSHMITVEGLKHLGQLSAFQESMVTHHGAQCGYCTPGFVMAMTGCLETRNCSAPCTPQEVKDALTGNLCRCTGYEPIIEAALHTTLENFTPLDTLYPAQPILADLKRWQTETVSLSNADRTYLNPATLVEALAFKAQYPKVMIVSGGTDTSVVCNKRGLAPSHVMSLSNLRDLDRLTVENLGEHHRILRVGASVLLSDLEVFLKPLVPEFCKILEVYGSPQIKNAGTLAGNIANGSPIGDSLPFLSVMEAHVVVQRDGSSRSIPFNKLYTGYRQLALAPDEMITEIQCPLPQPDEILKLYKVSRRKHLDISTFAAAILLKGQGEILQNARIAYGGVAPTVIRLPKTEAALTNQPFTLKTFEAAGEIARGEITPISDVRGSERYRSQLGENILVKCYYDCLAQREGALV